MALAHLASDLRAHRTDFFFIIEAVWKVAHSWRSLPGNGCTQNQISPDNLKSCLKQTTGDTQNNCSDENSITRYFIKLCSLH